MSSTIRSASGLLAANELELELILVDNQSSDGHLVVNERTLPMLRGWRDEADYLMDEDVQTLQQHLTKSGKRSPLARRKRK